MTIESPSASWKDYELVDSGDFEKLERFGTYILRRPEPKALWHKSLSEEQWKKMTHTRFRPGAGFGKAGKEDSGTWEKMRKMEDQWKISYDLGKGPSGNQNALALRLGLTSFKHVGVFPEQAPNWNWIFNRTTELTQTLNPGLAPHSETAVRPRILNLFAYTGAASLAARSAGGDVTHLDSVRQVVTWARQNMELSHLDGIRWIVEDAMKFVKRQARRGSTYNGIILDPPAYGHGPDGEKWKLDECLFEMLQGVNSILSEENAFLVLNLYSNGYSASLAETVAKQAFGAKGRFECGELALRDSFDKALPLSVFVRMVR